MDKNYTQKIVMIALVVFTLGLHQVNAQVGIGTVTPSESLDVVGNIKLSGALMPNNLPGTASQILISGGAGVPATWTPFIFVNQAATSQIGKYYASLSISGGAFNNGTFRTFTITDASCTTNSAISACFSGITPAYSGLSINSISVGAGSFRVILLNQTGSNIGNGSTIPIAWMAFY
jgi:hypothetical protein